MINRRQTTDSRRQQGRKKGSGQTTDSRRQQGRKKGGGQTTDSRRQQEMRFKFEGLEVWQDARELTNFVYGVTKSFPEEEKFGIISQLRRASVSVGLNIAEGSDRKTDKEFVRYLVIAKGSLNEVMSIFYIALDLGYIDKVDFEKVYEKVLVLIKRLNSLINAIIK